jgi:hypothetical protein
MGIPPKGFGRVFNSISAFRPLADAALGTLAIGYLRLTYPAVAGKEPPVAAAAAKSAMRIGDGSRQLGSTFGVAAIVAEFDGKVGQWENPSNRASQKQPEKAAGALFQMGRASRAATKMSPRAASAARKVNGDLLPAPDGPSQADRCDLLAFCYLMN